MKARDAIARGLGRPTREQELEAALRDCLALIDDMTRFVGGMALKDYRLLVEAPINARRLLRGK